MDGEDALCPALFSFRQELTKLPHIQQFSLFLLLDFEAGSL